MPTDGAISVTVTVSPAIGGGSGSANLVTTQAVLVEVSADGASALLFHVDGEGAWALTRCENLNTTDADCYKDLVWSNGSRFSDGPLAPRPSGSTTFHLLLIRQGRTYLLYANNTFLTAYRDDAGPAAPSGAIGLYLDAFGQTATFTNLAVYPVPEGMPFWAR